LGDIYWTFESALFTQNIYVVAIQTLSKFQCRKVIKTWRGTKSKEYRHFSNLTKKNINIAYAVLLQAEKKSVRPLSISGVTKLSICKKLSLLSEK